MKIINGLFKKQSHLYSNLSNDLRFSVVGFHVEDNHLANDKIHLHFNHRHIILQSITDYFDTLTQLSSVPPRIRQRSAASKKRKNKINHRKMEVKRSQFTLTRSITVNWKPKHIKHVLIQLHLRFVRILEVHKRTLTIQFNDDNDRDIADLTLPNDIFNADHFQQCFPQEH
jgi:hypothetical protein